MNTIRIAACSFIVLLILGLGLGYFSAHRAAVHYREQAVRWEASATAANAALEELQNHQRDIEKALSEREITIRTIRSDNARLRAKLQEAANADENLRQWLDAPLPDAVRELLYNSIHPGTKDSSYLNPGASTALQSSVSLYRHHQQRPAAMGTGQPGRAANLQR